MGPTGELAWLVTAGVVGLLILAASHGGCVALGRALITPKLEAALGDNARLRAALAKEQEEGRVSAEGRRRQAGADGAVDRVAGAGDPDVVLDGLRGLLPAGDGGPQPPPASPA